MASPAKRRKKNDGLGVPTAGAGVRNLDFFFGSKGGKQKSSEKGVGRVGSGDGGENGDRGGVVGGDGGAGEEQNREQRQETDEELARRLHEEWNGAGSVDGSGSRSRGDSGIAVVKEEVVIMRDRDGASGGASNGKPTPKPTNPPPTSTLGAEAAHATIPLDQDPLKFAPELYTPLIHSFPNSRATYALLTHCFVLITSTRSRIKIVDTLTNLLRLLIISDPPSLLPAVWLATNSIGPSYENNELGLGGSILSKTILKVTGISKPALKALGNKYGDLGDVAFDAKVGQRTLGMKKMVPLSMRPPPHSSD